MDEPARYLLKQQLMLLREVAVKQVKLTVWRQVCGPWLRKGMAIAAAAHKRRRRGADGDMIGMSIAPSGPKVITTSGWKLQMISPIVPMSAAWSTSWSRPSP